MGITYNVITHGTLTNNNGVLSNFSIGNFATLPLSFNQPQQPFEIVFKFNSNNISDEQVIFQMGNMNTTSGYIDIEIYESKLYSEIASENQQRWYIEGATTLSSNTDYWVKLTYDGIDTYSLYLSTDNTTWTTEGTATSSYYLGSTQNSYIGISQDLTQWYFNGSIDLNESYIDINNIRWWQGVTSTSTVQTRIQLRHDTSANWTSVNPVLLAGEVGIETDTLKQKVGDGVTAWNSLSYMVDMSSKQDALVSGTNIKTINNTSLLGSGNIDTSEIFIANGTTTYNEISNALLNGKTVFYNSGNIYHQYTYSTATEHQFASLITLYSGDIRVEYATVNTSNTWNIATYTVADTDLSNLSSTGKAVIDGQWQNVFQEAIGGTAQTINANSSKDIEFSSLPAKNCEVMFSINQSTSYDLAISSYLLSSTTNRALKHGCITVIMPVSSNKKIIVRNLGSGTASINFVRMCGYRVLGTNTHT